MSSPPRKRPQAAVEAASILRFVRLSDKARAPLRGSDEAAGFDLHAAESALISPGSRVLVKTDLQVGLPEGTYGRIAPRSGLAIKHSVSVDGGVVDRDYSGNVGVILVNFGVNPFAVAVGDRIAQLILEKMCFAEAVEVASLDATTRGDGGFGSTGI